MTEDVELYFPKFGIGRGKAAFGEFAAGVGRVFRRLAAIRRLAEPGADSPKRLGPVLASLQSLHLRLADAVRALRSHSVDENAYLA